MSFNRFGKNAIWAMLPFILGSSGCANGETSEGNDSDMNSDTDSDTGDTTPPTFCVSNQPKSCDCSNGALGVSQCAPDGSGWGNCACIEYGANLFVSQDGDDGNPGTLEAPFLTLERARDEIRAVKDESGLPDGGIAVWIRGGMYSLAETFVLGPEDEGTKTAPVVYRGYPGEEVRITGGRVVDGSRFEAVTDASPVWDRLAPEARGNLYQVNLATLGITDFGTLVRRGFCGESEGSPPEVFFDGIPMTLARWPDEGEGDGGADFAGEQVTVYGSLTPDVTGTFTRIGENDDVSVFQKDTLVDGLQFYLYRWYWEYEGTWYRAWFLTTDESGYPTDNGPWWYLYDTDLSSMEPSNGAAGNPVFAPADAIHKGMAYIETAVSDTEWTYAGNRPDLWTAAKDVWFHGWWEYAWADCQVAALSIDTSTRRVSLGDNTGYGIVAGQPYFAFNLLEEITVPGEYYIDRSSGVLYLYPPGPLDRADILISTLDDLLLDLSGTSYVQIIGVTLEAGRKELARINEGSDNLLEGVTLRNNGGRAVSISGTRNGIRNSLIYGTATGGLTLSGGDRVSLTPGENYVENSHIHHFGRTEWTYRPAVRIDGVGNSCENNLMHDAPHSAVLYGGNEHLIRLNEIHHVCEYSSDAGAVYAGRDWGARGNVIENNFIHHIHTNLEGYGVHGIYLDDCLSGIKVFGNILYEIENHAVQHGGGRDNLIDNNLMVRCGDAISADSRGFDWRPDAGPNDIPGDSWNLLEKLKNVNYQDEPWASAYPTCAAIPNDWNEIIADGATWLYPEGCTFNRNLGFENGAWMNGGRTFDHYASIADNIENEDPLFVDEANLDMTLKADSPALAIPGFVDIPFDQIGIHP
jgi:hypothetical protein